MVRWEGGKVRNKSLRGEWEGCFESNVEKRVCCIAYNGHNGAVSVPAGIVFGPSLSLPIFVVFLRFLIFS